MTDPSLVEVIEHAPNAAERPGPLSWWYRLAAPPEPGPAASLKVREAHRRGRLIAVILLAQTLIDLAVALTVGVFVNHFVIITAGAPIPLFLVGAWLNRRGKVFITALMLVVSIEVLLFALIINYAGGLSSFALPFFDLLVIGDLFAVSLLPEGSVFLVAGLNIAFTVGSLFLLPKTPELAALLQTSSIADAIARPCSIQAATAVVTFLWVRSAKRALERADRATTIAALQQSLAQQGQLIAQQKEQLEWGLSRIVEAHTRVAQGQLSARAQLPPENPLWQIAGLLNNALARVQHAELRERELQQVKQAVEVLAEALADARGQPIAWPRTGTIFDPLVGHYNTLAERYAVLVQSHQGRRWPSSS
jgi:hypothetical protein